MPSTLATPQIDSNSFLLSQVNLEHYDSVLQKVESLDRTLRRLINIGRGSASIWQQLVDYWGPMRLWKKALILTSLGGPLLAAGLISHTIILTAIGMNISLSVSILGFLLSNYFSYQKEQDDKLRSHYENLIELLTDSIVLLTSIGKSLHKEVFDFNKENDALRRQVERLSSVAENFNVLQEKLVRSEATWAQTTREFNFLQAQAKELLKDTRLQLEGACKALEKQKEEAAVERQVFQNAITELKKELEKAQQTTQILQETTRSLTALTLDKKQQAQFQESLQAFISQGSDSFSSLITQFSQMGTELKALTSELKISNARYNALINRERATSTTRFFSSSSSHEDISMPLSARLRHNL